MRLKGAKQVHYDSGPNMTPLVDIVMVILIFLMLAGSFGSSTQFLMSRRARTSGPPLPTVVEAPHDIDINLDAAGTGADDGFLAVCQSPPIRARNVKELKESLAGHRA